MLPDRIILTRDGVIGNVSKVAVGNNLVRILVIYGGLSVVLLYNAYNKFLTGQTSLAVMFVALAVLLLLGILNSLNNSATPIIEREKISEVRLRKAIPGLTRSRFEVLFEDDDGRIRKRLIMLPGTLWGGAQETQKAIEIMEQEGLLTK